MQFSDTTNKNGIIQTVEFWGNLGDGGISGNATLLKVITSRVNAGFDMLMPRLLSYTKNSMRWDDLNHTDLAIGTFDINTGQSDYSIVEDDNSLDILNVTDVKFFDTATQTLYQDLEQMTLDDPRAASVMSPNTDEIGIPTHYLESGNSLFLYPQPNYNATAGVKIFFEREQSYFASTDTTKEPGIPKPFHELLALYATLDWLLVNKAKNTALISRVEQRIARKENDLDDIISKRNPTRGSITPRLSNSR